MDGKILIVDDNEDVLFALNLLLEPYVEKIKVTTSPARIEYFMDNFNPDIILLDMNFSRDASSGQEGFLWLEKILQKDPQAVVLFITAYADTEKAVKAIRAGAIDFIPKPWETEKLLATVTRSSPALGRLILSVFHWRRPPAWWSAGRRSRHGGNGQQTGW